MPHSASRTVRETPVSFSMRASSAPCSFSFSLPVWMRQSETRRLRYCQIFSLNSGWLRIAANTEVSGLRLPITRV